MKSYDPDNPEWYYGSQDIIKENVVFLVQMDLVEDSTFIFLYFGENRYNKNDNGRVAEFYDDFSSPYRKWNERIYGGVGDDIMYSIDSDNDDFIYIVGSKPVSGNLKNNFKQFDVNGYEYDHDAVADSDDPGWDINLGYSGRDSEPHSVFATGSGDDVSVYIVGYSEDAALVKEWFIRKYDQKGSFKWMKTYNTSHSSEANDVAYYNGYVYVVGYDDTGTGSGKNWKILKYTSDGGEPGFEDDSFGGNGPDVAYSVAVDTRSGYGDVYVVGSTFVDGQEDNWCIKKYDPNGDEITSGNWPIIYDSGDSQSDIALDVTVDENGDVYVCGYVTKSGGNKNWLIKKFKENGDEIGEDVNPDGQGPPEVPLDPEVEWPLEFDSGNNDDAAYAMVIDKKSKSSDWIFTDMGELIIRNADPLNDSIDAKPSFGEKGGLYALDEFGEPYVFHDKSTKWEYHHNRYEYIRYDDPDHDGIIAQPENYQEGSLYNLGGLYALDPDGIPYTFKDKNSNWKFDGEPTDEIILYDIYGGGDNANPRSVEGNKDIGGFYAMDDPETGDPQPFIFRDLNYIYVGGHSSDETGRKNWRIKKFAPGGTEVINNWDKEIPSSSGEGGSILSLAIDSRSYVYATGYDSNLKGNNDKDGLIKKFSSGGIETQATRVNPEIWSMSDVSDISYDNSIGLNIKPNSQHDYHIISKDYTIKLDSNLDNVYLIELQFNHKGRWYDELSRAKTGLLLSYQGPKVNYNIDENEIQDGVSSYIFSISDIISGEDHSVLSFDKYVNGVSADPIDESIPYLSSLGRSGEGIKIKCFMYKEEGTGNVVIKSYLFHPSTNAPYEVNITFSDLFQDSPFVTGRIGVMGIYRISGQTSDIDWIRVIKTVKDQPIITIGSLESKNIVSRTII